MHAANITIEWLDSHTTLVAVEGDRTRRVEAKHATHRSAQVYVATALLRAAGWRVRPPASGEAYRRPLLLEGETMMVPLDGARADERAQGFTATRGDATLRVDASAGLEVEVLVDEGDTSDAWAIVRQVFPTGRTRSGLPS